MTSLAALGLSLTAGCATSSLRQGYSSNHISVVTDGQGPDVVLIPGLATSREVWTGTGLDVPGYRYHLVEVAGSNGTDPKANRAPGPLVGVLAEEVARYIREQQLEQPAVVGHSLGWSHGADDSGSPP